MADIELVIKISEKVKRAFDNAESNELKGSYYDHGGFIGKAIKNAIPLPKGHGRLIDADALEDAMCNEARDIDCWSSDIERAFNDGIYLASDILDKTPTIIEADKE